MSDGSERTKNKTFFTGCRFFDEETGRDQIYLEGSEWTRRKNGRLEKCSCFEVDGNAGFSCIFTDEDTFLLIADSNQIHKISILDKSGKFSILIILIGRWTMPV